MADKVRFVFLVAFDEISCIARSDVPLRRRAKAVSVKGAVSSGQWDGSEQQQSRLVWFLEFWRRLELLDGLSQ